MRIVDLRRCIEECHGFPFVPSITKQVMCPEDCYKHLRGKTIPKGCIYTVSSGDETPEFCKLRDR